VSAAAAAMPHGLGWTDFLYRRLRLKNPWNYKAPLLISLPYFMISVCGVPRSAALLGILLSVCTIAGIAGVAYFLNDLGDIEKDRLVGRDNAVAAMGPAARVFVFVLMLAAALSPWIYLPVTPLSAALLAAELALFVAYCFPPLRLKERGVLGLVTDALYAHALPAVLAVVTFSLMGSRRYPYLVPYLAALGAWQLALGLRNIVLHQLKDHDEDVASRTRTATVDLGPERVERLLRRAIVPAEVVTFGAFAAVVSLSMPFFAPAYLAYALWTWFRVRSGATRPAPSTLREGLYVYGDDFYADWLPLVVLGHLVVRAPAYWPLLAGHLFLFRNGIRGWIRDLKA
jgi:1,4-dihydroxy-2-naphthoate octaprenyltransferase